MVSGGSWFGWVLGWDWRGALVVKEEGVGGCEQADPQMHYFYSFVADAEFLLRVCRDY